MKSPKVETPYLAVLALAILAMYGASLSAVYIFADETWTFAEAYIARNPLGRAFDQVAGLGRPLQSLIVSLALKLVYLGAPGILALHWLLFLSSVAVAGVFYMLLHRLGVSRAMALALTVLAWSHPSFALHHVYSSLLQNWFGMLLSLAAVALWLGRGGERPPGHRDRVVAFALFFAGFLVYQSTPFFSAGLIAFAVLHDRRPGARSLWTQLAALMFLAFAVYSFGYLSGKHLFGVFQTKDTSLRWSMGNLNLFEFWNYPWPVAISPVTLLWTKILVALALAAVNITACLREVRNEPQNAMRWFVALVCVGMTLIPIIVDASGRQHLYPAAVAAIILVTFHSLRVLGAHLATTRLRILAGAALLVVVIGAGQGYDRGLVTPSEKMLFFIQASIAEQAGRGDSPPRHVVVVKPSAFKRFPLCTHQPCSSFYNWRIYLRFHLQQHALYRVAMTLAGWPGDIRVRFVDSLPSQVPDDTAVVDWNRYLLVEYCTGALKEGWCEG